MEGTRVLDLRRRDERTLYGSIPGRKKLPLIPCSNKLATCRLYTAASAQAVWYRTPALSSSPCLEWSPPEDYRPAAMSWSHCCKLAPLTYQGCGHLSMDSGGEALLLPVQAQCMCRRTSCRRRWG